jgi:LysR family transcriptional regulator, transcriptional activator of the cysJI operon
MHVETLKTFCDLVETGSLSRAARLNLVTQSAVSQQLRALEQRFGRRLIDRAPRVGARPTEAGRLVYQEARQLVDRLRALEEKLRAPGDAVTGTVRVGTVYSVGLHTLPGAMKKFLAAHPQVTVRLEYLRTDVVYQAVIDGQLDLGIVALPARRPALEVVPLRPDELVVVGPPDHPVVRRRTPTLASLAGQPFIAFERDIPTRKLVDRLLREQGVVVAPVMELDNIETIKRSVEAGLGLSILPAPALAAEVRARTLVARRPAGGPFRRAVGVIRRRGRELSAAARAFLERLERELGGSGT